jgi:hypothetical protein
MGKRPVNKSPDPIKTFLTALSLVAAVLTGLLVYFIQYASRW